MRTHTLRIIALLACIFLLSALSVAAQAPPLHDQEVGVTIDYDQASDAPVSGSAFYAKLTNVSLGLYSYTRIRETSINLRPKLAVQTQTETGFCLYTLKFGAFNVFTCGTGGISTAGDKTGISGGGNLLISKPIGNGWSVGLSAGPSFSGASGKVTYPVGLILSWGK